MTYCVTGSAGFIGSSVALALLERGEKVIGIDNHNDYYTPQLKEARLQRLLPFEGYTHYRETIENNDVLSEIFFRHKPTHVIHLAAQAGVRYSLKNPHAYGQSNLVGFLNILEACRHGEIQHLLYASSSSVYGTNSVTPFSEDHSVDHPISLYGATKRANELMAHSYSHLYGIPTTGLRFFTVYGPWGRPDMSYFSFTESILKEKPIALFNEGKMSRDFTYIDDITRGILHCLPLPPGLSDVSSPSTSTTAPFRLLNIGHHNPVSLMDYIHCLEDILGKKAILNPSPAAEGDMMHTYADVQALEHLTGYNPQTPLKEGLKKFVEWYKRDYVHLSIT